MVDQYPPDDGEFADPDSVALARVLDGLGPAPDADPAAAPAYEQALADVAAIARALGLIGDTLAAESADVAAPESAESADAASVASVGGGLGESASAAGGSAEPVTAGDDAVVMPLRRPRTRWMLAAAASLVGVIAVGTVAVVQHRGGSGSNSSVAQQPAAPAAAADAPAAAAAPAETPGSMMEMAPMAPESAPAAAAAAAPAAAAPPAAAASSMGSSGTGAKSSKSAAKVEKSAGFQAPNFNAAVACARGVVQGQVVGVTALGGGSYRLTLSVSEWIAPGSGPTRISYTVGSPYSADDSSRTKLAAGQQRVFIVPRNSSAEVLAYADSPSLRKRISQAQQQSAGQSCG